jgi:transcriptional regulator with XRE-family HTH domain
MVVDPTWRRRTLGIRLRRLREAARMTVNDAAAAAETSIGTISKLENAKAAIKQLQLRALLVSYGCDEDTIEDVLREAREAKRKGWWEEYSHGLPTTLRNYLMLETAADQVSTFEPLVVPALLQTEDYAREIGTLEEQIKVRVTRQARLTNADQPLRYWAIFEEQLLHRPVGTPAVMFEQLNRIAEMAQLPNVDIQVMPTERGYHQGLLGPLTLLLFDEPSSPDVGYCETAAGNIYVEKDWQVRELLQRYDGLRARALPPDDSATLILNIAKSVWKP